jgi:hypothetical protein
MNARESTITTVASGTAAGALLAALALGASVVWLTTLGAALAAALAGRILRRRHDGHAAGAPETH